MEAIFSFFKEPFIQTGLLTSLLLGGLCAYLGIFLVLRRIVFVGAALSQLAALGVAVGHLLGHWVGIGPEGCAFLFALAGAAILWLPFASKKLTKESWIGFLFAMAGSAAILVISKDPLAEAEKLDLFSGNILFVSSGELWVLAGFVAVVGLVHYLFHKEFLFVSFDLETARTLHLPARFYEFLLFLSFGATVAVGIKMAGLLFIFSSLVVPAVMGLRLSTRLPGATAIAVASILFSSLAGISLSYLWDLPTGPTISVTNALLLFPFLLWRR